MENCIVHRQLINIHVGRLLNAYMAVYIIQGRQLFVVNGFEIFTYVDKCKLLKKLQAKTLKETKTL
jgi:hypothetical protein